MPRAARGRGQHRCIATGVLLVGAGVVGERTREVNALVISIAGQLGQRLVEYRSEAGQLGTTGADLRWVGGEALADDDRRVGVLEGRRAGQQLKGRGRKRVLVRPSVALLPPAPPWRPTPAAAARH